MASLGQKLFRKANWLLTKAGMPRNGKNPSSKLAQCEQDDAKCMLYERWSDQLELARCRHELRKFQQQLEDTRKHHAVLYELVPVGCLTLDEKGRTLEVNQGGITMLGRERTHLLGKYFMAWLAESDHPQFLNYLNQVFLSRDSLAIELRIRTPNGILHNVRLESRATESAGHTLYCHMVMTDLSERKKADEASRLASHNKIISA